MDLMTGQGNTVLLFTLIHFTLGRSFSVLFAVLNQMSAFLYVPLALAYDYVQIPVYGIILEQSSKRFFPVRWLQKKADRILIYMNEKPLFKRILALVYDYVQIPVYGIILEQSSKRFLPVRWLQKKADRIMIYLNEKPLFKKILALGNVGLILLSALPIRGFGILSGSIVSFFMKKGKLEGTLLLMTGSVVGIFIIMGIAKGVIGIFRLF